MLLSFCVLGFYFYLSSGTFYVNNTSQTTSKMLGICQCIACLLFPLSPPPPPCQQPLQTIQLQSSRQLLCLHVEATAHHSTPILRTSPLISTMDSSQSGTFVNTNISACDGLSQTTTAMLSPTTIHPK